MRWSVLCVAITLILASCSGGPGAVNQTQSAEGSGVATIGSNVKEDTNGAPPDPNQNHQVLVRGDNFTITAEQFDDFLKGTVSETEYGALTKVQRLTYLNQLIDEELVTQEALKQGLENDPEIIQRITQALDNLLLDHLYRIEVIDKVTVTAAEIEEELKNLNDHERQARNPRQIAENKVISTKHRQRMTEYLAELLPTYPITFDDVGLNVIQQKLDDTQRRLLQQTPPKSYIASERDFELTDQEAQQIVAQVQGAAPYTVKDGLQFFVEIAPPRRPIMRSRDDIRTFIEKSLERQIMLLEAKRRGYEQAPAILKGLEAAKRSVLVSAMIQREITSKVKDQITETALRTYYDENKDKFQQPQQNDPQKSESLSFEEAKSSIEFELSRALKEKLELEWKQGLRKDRTIEILE